MVELIPLVISFAIGITCSLMACCIGMYLGLFAYLSRSQGKVSRISAGLMSAGFAMGVTLVVAALGFGVLLLRMELMNIMDNAIFVISTVGLIAFSVIGASYLLGRNLVIPLPYVGAPTALTNMRGYRAAPLYGAFFGGPGAAHCTFMLVIPIIFLGLSSRDPTAIPWNFIVFAAGRIIPIVVIGMMLQDAQVRFVKMVSARSRLINRVIGITLIISGVSLFFLRF